MKNFKIYIILLFIILFLTGCKAEKKQTSKIQKKDRAPSSLSDISQGIQDILKEIEDIEKNLDGTDIKNNETKNKEKEEQQDQNEDKNNKDETNAKEDEKKDKNKDKVLNRDDKLIDIWIKIDKKTEDIHNKWNLYEVEGIKKGISMEITDKLEGSLNSLTKSIEERNIANIYDYGSQSMLAISPIFHMYMDEIKGNINKIKYFVYQSYLKAVEGKNKEAWGLLENLGEDINQIRLKLEKDEEKIKILDKSNLSIGDMQKALKEKSIKLYRIKKDIIIKNLDELGK